ncbi:MAG: hypothetical protein AB1758_25305, partial [Candidatus Eremiobacterota bacterium]
MKLLMSVFLACLLLVGPAQAQAPPSARTKQTLKDAINTKNDQDSKTTGSSSSSSKPTSKPTSKPAPPKKPPAKKPGAK